MRFLREDLQKGIAYLQLALEQGYNLAGHPLDRELLAASDFILWDAPWDQGLQEYAARQGMGVHDIYGLVVELDWISQREDLVAVREFSGRELVFHPEVSVLGGKVTLQGYGLCLSDEFNGAVLEILHFPWNVPAARVAGLIDNLEGLRALEKSSGGLSPLNNHDMDAKNLENLKGELTALGFSEELAFQMEARMAANEPRFIIYDTLQVGDRTMELGLHFNQSRSSEYYYFNKYDLVKEVQGPLEAGEKYLVASQRQGDDPVVREFHMPSLAVREFNRAMEAFKEIRGAAQLCVGVDLASSRELAIMADGKLLQFDKEFYKTLKNPAPGQTFYVEKGNGFTLGQAVNLLSGRSVFREDVLDIGKREYAAWTKLDFDAPRDRGGNYHVKTFTEGYKFDLSETLDRFDFRELASPDTRELVENALRNGDRATVTVEMDGKVGKVAIEAVPEFKQVNIYSLEGKSIKREDHMKKGMEAGVGMDKGKEQAQKKGKAQQEGLSV